MVATANGHAPPPITELREKLEAKHLGLMMRLLEDCSAPNLVSPYEPYLDDKSFWSPFTPEGIPWSLDWQKKGELLPVYITEWGLKVLRDDSRRLCSFNPFALNIISTRQNYTIGPGFVYTAEEVPNSGAEKGDAAAVQTVIDDFTEMNGWAEREQEACARCDVDGEAFLRFFVQFDGSVLVRDVLAEQVRAPAANTNDPALTFGVETEPDDVESVLAYHVRPDPWSPVTERVDAEDVLHLKLNSHRNAKRGWPTLLPVKRNLERIDKLLKTMTSMAQVQAAIALIRTHTGQSAAAVTAFAQAAAVYQATTPDGKTENVMRYPPGSVLDASAGTKYDFPGGSVNAAAFTQVIQAELRAVGARVNMPEYMVSGDASNANYSSTMVAESPVVRAFERHQNWFVGKFGMGKRLNRGVMGKVVKAAVDAGRLPDRVLRTVTIKVTCPSLTTRDPLQEAQVRQIELQAGAYDPQSWAEAEGRDYAIVAARNAEHQERFGPGPGALELPGEDTP